MHYIWHNCDCSHIPLCHNCLIKCTPGTNEITSQLRVISLVNTFSMVMYVGCHAQSICAWHYVKLHGMVKKQFDCVLASLLSKLYAVSVYPDNHFELAPLPSHLTRNCIVQLMCEWIKDDEPLGKAAEPTWNGSMAIGVYIETRSLNCTWDVLYVYTQRKMHASHVTNLTLSFVISAAGLDLSSTTRQT